MTRNIQAILQPYFDDVVLRDVISLNENHALASTVSAMFVLLLTAGALGRADTATLLLWAAISLATILYVYRRALEARPRMEAADPKYVLSPRRLRSLYVSTLISALPWATAPLLLLAGGDPVVDTLVLVACAGMCAGGSFRNIGCHASPCCFSV